MPKRKIRKFPEINFDFLLESYNISYQDISDSYEELMKNWRTTFAKTLILETGKYIDGNCDWHVFSNGYTDHYNGIQAVNEYESLLLKKYTIIASDKCYLCQSNRAPKYSDLISTIHEQPFEFDTYITHHNFKWTFVITHDKYHGPYFAVK